MNYSFKQTLLKGVKYFVIFALPALADKFITNVPEVSQLTIGAVLVMAINWLKVRAGVKLIP